MKDIYVVTHTESIHHVEGKVGGWFDTGLTERGRSQARSVSRRLGELLGAATPRIVTSDLLRARETAEIIAGDLGCTVTLSGDLRELSCGIGEGKPEAWLRERFVPAPEDDRLDHRNIEGAESKRELLTRIYRAMDAISTNDHSTHIIVTHGFAMTFVVAAWIRMPLRAAGYINLRSTSGGISHLQEDDFFHNRSVRFLNDSSHLIHS
jgi:probable phosphoglycerate mutase